MTQARFGIVLIAVVAFASILGAQAPAQTKPPQEDEFLKGTYAVGTKDLVAPKVIWEAKPRYTPDAMRAKIQGRVKVQAVVMPDGTVGRARVTESLDKDLGLDEAALAAVEQWTFEPGKLKDQAVPVVVDMFLEFRLH